jgi:hypothetical protein
VALKQSPRGLLGMPGAIFGCHALGRMPLSKLGCC